MNIYCNILSKIDINCHKHDGRYHVKPAPTILISAECNITINIVFKTKRLTKQ